MNKYFTSILLSTTLFTSLQAELVVTYFDRGQVKAETNYIDGTNTEIKAGIKQGIEKVYYQMGKLAYKVNYIENKRDGKLTWYDKQGVKLSDVHYKMGKLDGVEYSYYPNGAIKHEVTYVNDLKEGLQKEYFKNKKLALEVPYVHGKKNGLQKEYTPEGQLYSEVNYVNNYKEGYQKWYDKNGQVMKTIFYKMDRPINIMKKVQDDKSFDVTIKGIDFSPQKPRD